MESLANRVADWEKALLVESETNCLEERLIKAGGIRALSIVNERRRNQGNVSTKSFCMGIMGMTSMVEIISH